MSEYRRSLKQKKKQFDANYGENDNNEFLGKRESK
jgi:hypothetical protein